MTPAAAQPSEAATGSSTGRRLAARLGIDLHPGEGTTAVLFFLAFFFIITFQYVTKTVRQSTFIDTMGAEKLPLVYLLVAIFSYPILRLYSRLADRLPHHVLIASTCGLIGLSMVGFWWLFQFSSSWVPVLFYVWVSIAFVMTVSQFWSFANHSFDPRQAKRLFGFVGAGGLAGGIAGGQIARLTTDLVGTRYALLVGAGIMGIAIGTLILIHRISPPSEQAVQSKPSLSKAEKAKGGFETIKASRQLQLIGAVLVLTVVVAQIVDLQFNWAVEKSITGLDERTAFYGNFFSLMGVLGFVFQLGFTSRIHRILGVGVAMRVLPVTMALGTGSLFAAAAFLPSLLLPSAFMLKIGENGIRYSLDQATRELLYLPVPAADRIKAKAFIDVFIQRSAKGLAAFLLLPVTFALITPVQAGWISLVFIVIWLGVTVVTYREYVRSFRAGLRARTVDTEIPINLSDVATLEVLVQALGSSDTRQVLQSLEILSSNNRGNLVPPLLLYHDDETVRRKTLEVLRETGRRDASHLIERRLGDASAVVRAEAIDALAHLHGEDVCELMLPRLKETDASVRAAAVACLANHGDEAMIKSAGKVLNDLMSDASAEVRSEAAKALGAIHEPQFQERVVRLLYDRESKVVREAIEAVQRRVGRDGYNPIYVPTLVSLLRNRRVKHDAREALIAFGEPVLPALVHFMKDPGEPIWVRRALPMTLARIDSPKAAEALVAWLGEPEDAFLRRRLIASLSSLSDELKQSLDAQALEKEIKAEANRYHGELASLQSFGMSARAALEGPVVVWDTRDRDPDLLDRLLTERLAEHLSNLFALLSVLHPPKDIWAAHRSLISGQMVLRNNALEYLDNTLEGEVHRHIFSVINDVPLDDKLRVGRKQFGTPDRSAAQTLNTILKDTDAEEAANHLALAAMYKIHTDEITGLYAEVGDLKKRTSNKTIQETADWVLERS